MRPERRFLLACIAIAGVALIAVFVPAQPILRTLVALPLVFVLPGEAMLRATGLRFPRLARAPIVVGVSMGIAVLGGLLLDWLGGLTPLGWAAWLGGVSVLGAVVARRGVASTRPALPTVTIRHGIMLVATCGVLAVTVLSALRSTEAYRPFRYTNFWIVPRGAPTDAYVIGIKNGEGQPESYAVRLMVDQRLSGEWQNLVLGPGQDMTLPIAVPPGAQAQAFLFRTQQPNAIYRTVTVAGTKATGADAETAAAGGGW